MTWQGRAAHATDFHRLAACAANGVMVPGVLLEKEFIR